jgi:hypothetical protein
LGKIRIKSETLLQARASRRNAFALKLSRFDRCIHARRRPITSGYNMAGRIVFRMADVADNVRCTIYTLFERIRLAK